MEVSDLMWFVALKGLIYTIICIQVGIFNSDEYKEFIFNTLLTAIDDNENRGTCMTYAFNNARLKKEC